MGKFYDFREKNRTKRATFWSSLWKGIPVFFESLFLENQFFGSKVNCFGKKIQKQRKICYFSFKKTPGILIWPLIGFFRHRLLLVFHIINPRFQFPLKSSEKNIVSEIHRPWEITILQSLLPSHKGPYIFSETYFRVSFFVTSKSILLDE